MADPEPVEVLTGIGVSPGLRAGPVRIMADRALDPGSVSAPDRARPPAAGREAERLIAIEALNEIAEDLRARGRQAAAAGNIEAKDVLEAQAMMATDPVLAQAVAARAASGASAAQAVADSLAVHRETLAKAGPYLAGRVADLDDIRDRVVARLLGTEMPGVPDSDRPFVLVARDLAPAETALLDPAMVIAFVTEEGGPTSHSAILARAMGIPAVVSCQGCTGLADGTIVTVDGASGRVAATPSPAELQATFRQEPAAAAQAAATGGPGGTKDGHAVPLLANIGGPRDVEGALAYGAEGVGLFRTEFLFLDRPAAPSVEEQVAAYRTVFQSFPHGPVVVRVLDAGADKPLGFLPPPGDEPNPALGERGLRMLRRHPAVLDGQLTALSRAAEGLPVTVAVMAPMVTDADDAEFFVEACRRYGIERAGIMIEVPAAALRAGDLMASVDFVSIGTNDLVQYTFAADRQAGGLARLQDAWQPALLDLIGLTGAAAADSGTDCGVCGEAAAEPALACVLVGLGATSLSMSAPALPRVRGALAAHTIGQCREAATAARLAGSAAAARAVALSHLPNLGTR